MSPDPDFDSAFPEKRMAASLELLLEKGTTAFLLMLLTVGIIGIMSLDLTLGSFVLSTMGIHGAILDVWFMQIHVPAGFIALIVSATFSAAKLGAWDALLTNKVKGHVAWITIAVMIAVSMVDVVLNVSFVGYYVRGVVPAEIISSQAGILETSFALGLGVLTMFDALIVLQLVHHLRNHK